MATGGISLASGTRVSLAYARECVRGTTPAAVGTATTTLAADAESMPVNPQIVASSSYGTGYSDFVRASGSWIDDGYRVGMTVTGASFTDTDANANHIVHAVTATTLTVVDAGDLLGDEAAGSGTITIAGHSDFVRTSGSFVTDGYARGQKIRSAGFGTAANNADWVVSNVTALRLTVEDGGDAITDEAEDAGNTTQILLKTLRATGRAINLQKNILESEEVRPSAQKSDVRHGFNRVAGSPGFELSAQSYDEILELALRNYWHSVAVIGSPDLQMDSTGGGAGAANIVRAAGSFVSDGFRPGDLITTAGFATGANNATKWLVTAVTATTLTIADPNDVTADDASTSGPTVTYPGQRLDLGTTLMAMYVQRRFADISQYQDFNGVAVNQLQNSIQPEQIVGGSFDLIGISAAAMASSPVGLTPLTAPVTSPYSAFEGVLYEGGSIISVVTGLDYTLALNRTAEPVIGSKFTPDIFDGTATLQGTLTAFFQDETLFNKFVNETESIITLRLDDPDGTNFLTLNFPRVKYNGGDMDPPQEGPVPINMPFQSLEKSLALPGGLTSDTSFFIQRSNVSSY